MMRAECVEQMHWYFQLHTDCRTKRENRTKCQHYVTSTVLRCSVHSTYSSKLGMDYITQNMPMVNSLEWNPELHLEVCMKCQTSTDKPCTVYSDIQTGASADELDVRYLKSVHYLKSVQTIVYRCAQQQRVQKGRNFANDMSHLCNTSGNYFVNTSRSC